MQKIYVVHLPNSKYEQIVFVLCDQKYVCVLLVRESKYFEGDIKLLLSLLCKYNNAF